MRKAMGGVIKYEDCAVVCVMLEEVNVKVMAAAETPAYKNFSLDFQKIRPI